MICRSLLSSLKKFEFQIWAQLCIKNTKRISSYRVALRTKFLNGFDFGLIVNFELLKSTMMELGMIAGADSMLGYCKWRSIWGFSFIPFTFGCVYIIIKSNTSLQPHLWRTHFGHNHHPTAVEIQTLISSFKYGLLNQWAKLILTN